MTNPASGLFKQVAYKAETSFGVIPSATSAQSLRRVQSTLDLTKETYQSNEIRRDFQMADFRHGVRRVEGRVSGELSPSTYKDFIQCALKRDFAAVTPVTGASVTIAGAGPSYTVTRGAGDFITDGFKVGDVIRLSVGSPSLSANFGKNLVVVGLTTTVATVITANGSAMAAEGPVAGTTITVIGKKTFIPQTGHTDKSFSVEHYYADLVQSEVFSGCKPTAIAIGLPPTGLATIDVDFMGQNVTTASSQYFTNPTAPTTTGLLAAVNGQVRVGGSSVATLTGLTLNIASNYSGDPVVGSNTVPFMFAGRVIVTGQATAYFDSVALRDAFFNESEVEIIGVFTANNDADAPFMSFVLPRVKIGGASKNDGEGGLVQTLPFQALLNTAGGTGTNSEQTTIVIQDSAA
jgi:hypothetical protein